MKGGPPLLDLQVHLGLLEWMAREESQETLHLVTQDPLEKGVFQECQALKDTKVTRDAQGLKVHPASLDLQVSKVPKAEKEVLGFQGSQVLLATPVKEVLQGSQDNQDFLELPEIQVPQAGKANEETWGLLDQLG